MIVLGHFIFFEDSLFSTLKDHYDHYDTYMIDESISKGEKKSLIVFKNMGMHWTEIYNFFLLYCDFKMIS